MPVQRARSPPSVHRWSSGQEQAATIKQQLKLLLPGIHIFLDVDDLRDGLEVEACIQRTQCILILLRCTARPRAAVSSGARESERW